MEYPTDRLVQSAIVLVIAGVVYASVDAMMPNIVQEYGTKLKDVYNKIDTNENAKNSEINININNFTTNTWDINNSNLPIDLIDYTKNNPDNYYGYNSIQYENKNFLLMPNKDINKMSTKIKLNSITYYDEDDNEITVSDSNNFWKDIPYNKQLSWTDMRKKIISDGSDFWRNTKNNKVSIVHYNLSVIYTYNNQDTTVKSWTIIDDMNT